MELQVFDNDPALYLFTSLTAGSSHIVTATSRIETILKANRIPFTYKDTATDDLARKLFQRRAMGKKLPLLVKEGFVIGDLNEIEEWNEYGELAEAIGPIKAAPSAAKPTPTPSAASTPAKPAAKQENKDAAATLAMRTLSAEAAAKGAAKKPTPVNISTTNPRLTEKVNTPTTPSKAAAGGILSPKSVPLPATPTSDAAGKKGEASKASAALKGLSKPADNKYKSDAPPKDVKTGGVSEAPVAALQHRGSNVAAASAAEIKDVEKKNTIKEESSEDEESEDESEEEEDESEEESDEESDGGEATQSRLSPMFVEKKTDIKVESEKVKTPLPAKVESKIEAGPKKEESSDEEDEDEDDEDDDDDDDDEDESEEEEEKAKTPAPAKVESNVKAAPKKEESSEEEDDDDDDESEEDEDEDEDESDEEPPVPVKTPAVKTQVRSAKVGDKTSVGEKSKEASKTPAVQKTQKQSAKAGDKAGVSVED